MDFSHTSIIYYFIVMPVIVIFSKYLLDKIPFYKDILAGEERGRFETLDGLRGFWQSMYFFNTLSLAIFTFKPEYGK